MTTTTCLDVIQHPLEMPHDAAAVVTRDLKPTPPHETTEDPLVADATSAIGTTTITRPAETAPAPVLPPRRVHFADADIIEFEPTIWTSTVASDGVPVGLSSTVRRRTRRRLDALEGERRFFRVDRQEYMEHGYLEPDERLELLESTGHSLTTLSHVERESIRINRERWESNEYDLLYQYGLGETALLDLDDEEEMLLSEGTMARLVSRDDGDEEEEEDVCDGDRLEEADDTDMLEAEDEEDLEQYYYANRAVLAEADVRFAMDDLDAYDTRKYDEWAWDYTSDCILGDNDEGDELPYAQDAFDPHAGTTNFDVAEMSTSPSDVSSSAECMIVACSNVGKLLGGSSPGTMATSRMFV